MGFVKAFGIMEGQGFISPGERTQAHIPGHQPSTCRSPVQLTVCGLLQPQPLPTALAELSFFELWLGVLVFVVVVMFYATFQCVYR